MECPRCNTGLTIGTRFCPTCGLPVEELVQELAEQERAAAAAVQEAAEKPSDAAAAGDAAEVPGEPEPTVPPEPDPEPAAVQRTDVQSVAAPRQPGAEVGEEAPNDDYFPYEPTEGRELEWPQSPKERLRDFVRSHKRAIVAVAAAVLALVVAIAAIAHANEQAARARAEQRAAEAAERALSTPQDVRVILEVPGYEEGSATPVPLQLTGTTEAGSSIDEIALVTPGNPTLPLVPGSYQVSLAGSPVTSEGLLYMGSVDTFEVTVSKGGDPAPSSPVFVFVQIPPENVRDSDIDAARDWMGRAGIADAQVYLEAIEARRNEALAQLESEGALREDELMQQTEDVVRQLEDDLRTTSLCSNEYFSFELPAQWRGNVDVTQEADAQGRPQVIMHLAGNRAAELARVCVEDGADVTDAGGTEQHVVAARTSPTYATHVEARTINWPWIVATDSVSYFGDFSEEELEELVRLSTGGSLELYQVWDEDSEDSAAAHAEREFSEVAFQSLVAY